jgi:hypothetical protein
MAHGDLRGSRGAYAHGLLATPQFSEARSCSGGLGAGALGSQTLGLGIWTGGGGGERLSIHFLGQQPELCGFLEVYL